MSGKALHLRVATPSGTVVDEPVVALRAEDVSGHFGIRPGHEDFCTALAIGILSYRTAAGAERFVAVRRGVLWVKDGEVAVVTRDAAAGDDLADLEGRVVESFVRGDADERRGSAALTKWRMAAMRCLVEYEDAGRRQAP